jgi:hypothetical protein
MENKPDKDFTIEIEFTTKTDEYALFDPHNLERFCLANNITTGNLADFFNDHEKIGMLAKKAGVIIPVYPYHSRPADYQNTYRMIFSGKRAIKKEYRKWMVRNMVMEIIGGTLALADMSVLREWNADYYKNLKQGAPAYYLMDIENGMYNLTSIGFNCGGSNYGDNYVLKRKLAE